MTAAIVLVSHSDKLAEALQEMILEMIPTHSDTFKMITAAGTNDGRLGTTPLRILEKVHALHTYDDIYLFYDMGSALLSAETAIDFLDDAFKERIHIFHAPIVEGTHYCAVQCSLNKNRDEVITAMNKHF